MADFLRVVKERRILIRNVTLAVVALTAVTVMLLPTLYSTSAIVMLDQRKNNVADLSSVLSALPTDPSSVQNQIQVLSSRDLALQVIEKLKLTADPEFNPSLSQSLIPSFSLSGLFGGTGPARDMREAAVTAFLNRLDVTALGLSTSIDVSFTSRDPGKAALIANTLARTYTEDQVFTKVDAGRKATQWLSERIRQLAQQAQQQESAVELYKAEHDLVESADGKSLTDQQLVAINAQLIQAQSDLAEKQAAYERVQAVVKSGHPADVTQVVSSKMIGDLRTQEALVVRQEAELATRYGPNHPKMIAVRNEKRDLETKINQEVASIAGSIASDLAVARAHVGSIKASLARVEKQARTDNMARVKLKALEANLASTRTMYESFVTRLRAVQDQDAIQNPEARVISTAPVPSSPSSPHRKLFVLASIPAGLLLGILLALALERFQGPMPAQDKRYEPVPRAGRVEPPPLLAELPATADLRAADWVADNPASPYGQALNRLLSRFVAVPGTGGRVVVLTSPGAHGGKAVIALALARLAARQGLRTVLVDADRGRILPPQGSGTGLAALLGGSVRLSQVLRKDARSAAALLSAPPGGMAWASARTGEIFAHFRRTCDLVIVDAAPVGTAGAWPALARLADHTVLVADKGAPQAGFENALRWLVATGAPTAGMVIT